MQSNAKAFYSLLKGWHRNWKPSDISYFHGRRWSRSLVNLLLVYPIFYKKSIHICKHTHSHNTRAHKVGTTLLFIPYNEMCTLNVSATLYLRTTIGAETIWIILTYLLAKDTYPLFTTTTYTTPNQYSIISRLETINSIFCAFYLTLYLMTKSK